MFFKTNTTLKTVWSTSPVINQSFKTIWTTSYAKQKCKRKALRRSQPIYTWQSKQTKIHHHQLNRFSKLKSILGQCGQIHSTHHHAFIFNFSVKWGQESPAPLPLVMTCITHWRGANPPCNFSDQQLYRLTKYFPSRFLTRSLSKTSNNKC